MTFFNIQGKKTPGKFTYYEFFIMFKEREDEFNVYLLEDFDRSLSRELRQQFVVELIQVLYKCTTDTLSGAVFKEKRDELKKFKLCLENLKKYQPDVPYMVLFMTIHRKSILDVTKKFISYSAW